MSLAFAIIFTVLVVLAFVFGLMFVCAFLDDYTAREAAYIALSGTLWFVAVVAAIGIVGAAILGLILVWKSVAA